MSKHKTTGTILRVTTLSAALLMAFGSAPAFAVPTSNLTLDNGHANTAEDESYDYVDVRYGSPKSEQTTLDATNLTINDSRVSGKVGAVLAKGAAININDSKINTTGINYGLQAYSSQQGEAETSIVGNNLTITTSHEGAHGAVIYIEQNSNRSNTNLTLNNSTITTTGVRGYGLLSTGTLYPTNTGTGVLTGNKLTINTSGDTSIGVKTELLGKAVVNNSSITTNGLKAVGAYAETGGSIVLDGGSIYTANKPTAGTVNGTESRSYGIQATGAGSKVTTKNGTTIKTEGQRSYGAYAIDGGKVELNGGSISTNGFMAYGVYASGADSTLTTNNVNITTTGAVGDAVWAYKGGVSTINGGTLLVQGAKHVDGGETANGLSALGGVAGVGDGVINVKGATIKTTGDESVGALAGADVGSDKTSGTINLDNTSITVTGAKAVAAEVNYGSTLTTKNGSKLVSTQGDGIVMSDNATVTLDKTTLQAKGASLVSNLNTSGSEQNISIKNGSAVSENNGTLLLVNRTANGQDGKVNLALESGAFTAGNVDDRGATGTGKTVVANNGAHWAGIVLVAGDTVVADGATQTYTDTNVSGNVASGSNSTTTFTAPVTIQGSVAAGTGSTVSFAGPTTINSNLAALQNSIVSFIDAVTVGGSVTGVSGSTYNFGGATTIGGGTGTAIAGEGTNFVFSPAAPITINGNVLLTDGSTTHGGSVQTPVSISGDVTVQNSTLGGNLDVGGTVSSQGGLFNPGNSVGTQTFDSAGTLTDTEYRAEINAAGQSDKIVINTGNIDISDVKLTVAQENGNGGYLINHDYTILQTKAGVVENEFRDPTLAANFGDLLKLNVKYDNPAEVRVGLSVDDAAIDAERAGWSDNQNATYDGLMSASAGNTLATAALMDPDVKNALNQLSGEVHASTQTALMNSSGVVARTLSNRMRSNFGAGMVAGAPTAQAYGATAGSMPRSAAYPLWAEVVGNWSSLDGNNNTAKTKTDIGGLFIGGDAAVGGSGWRLGGALGFTDGKIKTDDRNSRSDVTSYTAALYGGNSWETAKGKVNFLAGAAYTRHDVDSRRSVTVGGNQTLKASYDVNTTQLFTELGYALPVGAASTIEPYVGLAWLSQDAKSFKESGGSAALSGKSQKDDITTFTLGLRGKTTVDVGANQANLMAGLGWRHAAGDVDATRTMSFIQGNGAGFKIAGAPIAKNAAVLDLAAEMGVGRNAAMGLSYAGQFGDGNTDSAGTLYLKVKF
ncbi:autotransporter domain-containing protein [Allopusillimonas ginsengisoli]|uniref:autotransporter domain-containing protein n=1 Tax=Allopusillimonas ginsengisoli TaxID=453575 RepID=UPI0039C33136